MGDNLSTVRVAFTVDLTPYVAGLKTMLSMTSAAGQQLTPLLSLKANANTKVFDTQLKALEKTVDDYIGSQVQAVQGTDQLGTSIDNTTPKVNKSTQAHEKHGGSMRGVKRESLEMFGAISFLGTSIISLASSSEDSSSRLSKLSRGMNEGISAGFGLASMLSIVGIASGGTAVVIGALVTIGTALFRMFDDSEARAKKFQAAMQSVNDTLRGASLSSLEEFRGRLLAVHQEQEQQAKDLDQQAAKWTKWGLLGQLAGYIFANGLDKQRSSVKEALAKIDGYIDETNKSIGAKEKSAAEVRDFINQASTAATIDQFAKQRAEAKLTLDKELEDYKGHADAMQAARKKYQATMKQIAQQEADFNQQIADAQFETELSKIRTHGIQLGAEQSTIDLQIIQARKQHYQQQLDNLDNLVMSERERTKRRADLEKTLTGVIEEETAKRKQVDDAHQAWLDKSSELGFQKALADLRTYGLQHGQIEEEIGANSIAIEKQFTQGQLQQLEVLHNAGKVNDADFLTRKQQLYVKLSQLDGDQIVAQRNLWEQTHQAAITAYDGIGSIAQSTFNRIFSTQRQAKNFFDAMWLDMQGTAIGVLGDILRRSLTNYLIDKAAHTASEAEKVAATAASVAAQTAIATANAAVQTTIVTASMGIIASAALPAAILVSIASFGGADAAATASMIGAMATMKGASLAILGMDKGGRLKPGEMAFNESVNNEIFMPEEDLKKIMRAEMIPMLRMDVAKQEQTRTINNIVEQGKGRGIGIEGSEIVGALHELRDIVKNQKLVTEIDAGKIRVMLVTEKKKAARAGRTLPPI